MYLTYGEYCDWVSSETADPISESLFDDLEFKARKRIDYWTDCRIQKMAAVPAAVKSCMKVLIKIEQRYGAEAQMDSKPIASFSTDGYSESYGSISEQQSAANRSVERAIREWLYGETDDNGTPLLYRGVVR